MMLRVASIVCALMVCPLAGFANQSEKRRPDDDELRAAHEALREAVETIRVYHEGHGGTYTFHITHDEDVETDSRRPRLGVVVEADKDGAKVVAVTPSGPADEAGLRTGDVITAVDSQALADGSESPSTLLVKVIDGLQEGDTVAVSYLRDGAPHTATVTLRPVEMDVRILKSGPVRKFVRVMPGDDDAVWMFPHSWSDMELVALNPDLGEYFGTDEGVLVVRASESVDLGLKGGDVIVSIDNRVVTSPTHAMRILRSYEPGEHLTMEIMRRGHRETVEATVPDRQVDLVHGDERRGFEYRWHESGDQ